jgi:hypothetical protein
MTERQFSSIETGEVSHLKAVLEQRKQFVDLIKGLSHDSALNTKLTPLNGNSQCVWRPL